MRDSIVQELRNRRPVIRARWAMLVKIEKVPTPLGHPDVLVHLFDQTFDEVMAALLVARGRPPEPPPHSACSCNPLAVYFPALEQALLEALVLVQAGDGSLPPAEREAGVDQLRAALHRIARRDLAVYDELCFEAHRRDGTRPPAAAPYGAKA